VDETLPAGQHNVMWDGRDTGGTGVASGVYFVRFRAGTFSDTTRMLLLK
jgi:flagellar hook assembly protein FlgD